MIVSRHNGNHCHVQNLPPFFLPPGRFGDRVRHCRARLHSRPGDAHRLRDLSGLDVTVRDAAEPGQFTVHLSYDADDLPIWNLFTYALPDRQIERFSTIRIGGL
jgi:hypothetical protein